MIPRILSPRQGFACLFTERQPQLSKSGRLDRFPAYDDNPALPEGTGMQHPAGGPNPLIGYAVTGVIIALVLALRLRRMSRATPLKVERLWVIPAVYAVLAATMVVTSPPQGLGWAGCAAALALGSALGWQRGRMMRIEVDPETHALSARSSPWAILFIVALVLLRSGLRAAAQSGVGLHVSAATLTDVLVAFALGLLGTQRLEMYLRARRLIEAARGA
jgi:hypothetical protein